MLLMVRIEVPLGYERQRLSRHREGAGSDSHMEEGLQHYHYRQPHQQDYGERAVAPLCYHSRSGKQCEIKSEQQCSADKSDVLQV